jgi:multisite-specific tRNA:(cytosine-C5)-methyltransferase
VLSGLHEWLKFANEYGSITRQEAVSMAPPLFLGVQPTHRVLDMCAAPGSKTLQLLEALHAGLEPGVLPSGLVMANDSDLKRCNLLTHQTKRAASAGLIVTNHDAATFPELRDGGANGGPLRFDRVLADVPCSGDGTLRKAPDIWGKWHVGIGTGLHAVQLRIALRAARLLAVGGVMVYSTCSFNPVENEAVVAALLRACGGALVLDDCSAELPALRRAPGLRTWQVWDKSGVRSADDPVPAEGTSAAARHKHLKPTLFSAPPGDAEADGMHLERCMRVLPHHGDTGGFFIARMTKLRELPKEAGALNARATPGPAAAAAGAAGAAGADAPAADAEEAEEEEAEPEEEAEEDEAATAAAAAAAAAKPPAATPRPGGGFPNQLARHAFIDPVVPVDDAVLLDDLSGFYGLSTAFPFRTQLVTRLSDGGATAAAALAAGTPMPAPRRLYLVTPAATELLRAGSARRLKIMAAGLKLFERGHDEQAVASGGCSYRLVQEGLRAALPHTTRQRVVMPLDEFTALARDRTVYFSAPDHAKADAPRFTPDIAAAMLALAPGCVIAVPDLSGVAPETLMESAEDLAIAAWKGKVSLAVLVSKPEAVHLLQRLYRLCPHMAPGKAAPAAAAAAAPAADAAAAAE